MLSLDYLGTGILEDANSRFCIVAAIETDVGDESRPDHGHGKTPYIDSRICNQRRQSGDGARFVVRLEAHGIHASRQAEAQGAGRLDLPVTPYRCDKNNARAGILRCTPCDDKIEVSTSFFHACEQP